MSRPPRKIELSELDLHEMICLYRQGWGCTLLARRYGCLSGSIHRLLIVHGVQPRKRGGPRRRTATYHTGGYIKWGKSYVHRIVAEAWLDRPLKPGEVVHHKDGDKTNNHPDNLEVFASTGEHLSRAQHWYRVWTPERELKLIELRAAGLTHAAIAREMGLTKFAISMKCTAMIAEGRIPKRQLGKRVHEPYAVSLSEAAATTQRLWEAHCA